jgi:hypothetical protein
MTTHHLSSAATTGNSLPMTISSSLSKTLPSLKHAFAKGRAGIAGELVKNKIFSFPVINLMPLSHCLSYRLLYSCFKGLKVVKSLSAIKCKTFPSGLRNKLLPSFPRAVCVT